MKLISTPLIDLFVIDPTVFEDNRGFFYESYNAQKLKEHNIDYQFIQDNHSKSSYGVLRGLHYQNNPFAQTKLVRVTQGKVLDVAVDIRKGSPTYLQHFAIELSAENKLQLLIPAGFAHGFVVLSETCEFLYKCDNYYNKAAEGGIAYNDATLNIDWKIPKSDILLSEKDAVNPTVGNANSNFTY
ncbi:MAG TPA: dTDP-4-dehydrorhamnose 3,5-epimerase [Chitinophagales bacterium]|jgi:dTDP-4-dehydrorhamnose 3,5-epimerase|nr:dTDP-4-dehydrorhamnose 3,5-epimerase [Chitinophagales bacterium]